jgi:hypothetical protein
MAKSGRIHLEMRSSLPTVAKPDSMYPVPKSFFLPLYHLYSFYPCRNSNEMLHSGSKTSPSHLRPVPQYSCPREEHLPITVSTSLWHLSHLHYLLNSYSYLASVLSYQNAGFMKEGLHHFCDLAARLVPERCLLSK